ncbi:MAG: flagellar biosynthetic protein FliO [Gammaproteobacteria bacterium]|nr:flagellar biosynthetic protein FliO [Gammaproteobacteria bacterium]
MSNLAVSGMLFLPSLGHALEKAGTSTAVPAASGVSAGSLLQVTLGLALVLLIIGGMAWMLRRYGKLKSSTDGSLKVLSGLSVGPRERVILMQVGEEQVLIGVAPGRVQTLHVLEMPVPLSSPLSATTGAPRADNKNGKVSAVDMKTFATKLSLAVKQRMSS